MDKAMSKTVRRPAPRLAGIEAYDPQYLPAGTRLSANESPYGLPEEVQQAIRERMDAVGLNRYPDPLANALRDQIAQDLGLERENVLIGDGGDELLFNLALAWGGPGRTLLDFPPTFVAYGDNARITGTEIVGIPRKGGFGIDEEAALDRVAQGDIDFVAVASPNNPTGKMADPSFVLRLLAATDALVLVDEAYFEFAGVSAVPYLGQFKNLAVLRTFSKAYCLAGARLGYLLADADVINELVKVRQPYSVNALSQLVGSCVYGHRACFKDQIALIVEERGRLFEGMNAMGGVEAYPSDANFILFKTADAAAVWESLYAQGVLVRDFSHSSGLEGCLRVTVGSPQDNKAFLAALEKALEESEMI